jgi:hypothetical protein
MSIIGRPAQIADALLTHALLMEAQGPKLPVSVPEPAETFVPPVDAFGNALAYLEVTNLPNRDKWQGLRHGRIRQGLFQVTVVWPKNQGSIRPLEAAGLVEAHFAKNTALVSGDAQVRIAKEPWTADAIPGDIDSRYPVTIEWTCGG